MIPEELLNPRYKVIADYPKCPFSVGAILEQDLRTVGEIFTDELMVNMDAVDRLDRNWIDPDVIDKHPHLFRKLEWWEERELSDFTDYLKGLKSIKKVISYEYHGGAMGDNVTEYPSVLFENDSVWCPIWMFLPATESEYIEYLNQKTPQ